MPTSYSIHVLHESRAASGYRSVSLEAPVMMPDGVHFSVLLREYDTQLPDSLLYVIPILRCFGLECSMNPLCLHPET